VTGSSQYDTIALHRIDDYTAEASLKHAGKEIMTARRVVAPGGKTMTITVKSADPHDASLDITAVYDSKNNCCFAPVSETASAAGSARTHAHMTLAVQKSERRWTTRRSI